MTISDVGVVQTRRRGARAPDAAELIALGEFGLVCRISRGDQAALAEAYARHGASCHAAARVVCGADRADAVVQEVFLRLWREPQRFDAERGSLRTFLMVQGHTRAVDLVRGDVTRRSPEDIAADEVSDRLSVLPKTERDAIWLAYFGGYTYAQAATILHQPERTIRRRIRRGLRHLRSRLAASNGSGGS